jgi:endonuclease YncB( thermonuclease family)
MKVGLAVLFALLLTGALWNVRTTFYAIDEGDEEIIVTKVIDGDTFKDSEGRTFRLVNINAPEKNSPLAIQAQKKLQTYENKKVSIRTLGTDKYHRLLVKVFTPTYLNMQLVQEGLASTFLVQDDEREAFGQAEEQAIKEQRGIWKKSHLQGCVRLRVEEKAERITLYNTCLGEGAGWYLKDESRKIYKFTAPLPSILEVYSGEGVSNESAYYWREGAVWNNEGDTAYLFDGNNALVAYYKYGYGKRSEFFT